MTLEADILSDCELFDAVQTVTLTLLDGTTESVAYVTTSKLPSASAPRDGSSFRSATSRGNLHETYSCQPADLRRWPCRA